MCRRSPSPSAQRRARFCRCSLGKKARDASGLSGCSCLAATAPAVATGQRAGSSGCDLTCCGEWVWPAVRFDAAPRSEDRLSSSFSWWRAAGGRPFGGWATGGQTTYQRDGGHHGRLMCLLALLPLASVPCTAPTEGREKVGLACVRATPQDAASVWIGPSAPLSPAKEPERARNGRRCRWAGWLALSVCPVSLVGRDT